MTSTTKTPRRAGRTLSALIATAAVITGGITIAAPNAMADSCTASVTVTKTAPDGTALAGATFTVAPTDREAWASPDIAVMDAADAAFRAAWIADPAQHTLAQWDASASGAGATKSVTVTTGSDGKATAWARGFTRQCSTGWTVTETKAPDGYLLDASPHAVAVPALPAAAITVVNEKAPVTPETPTTPETPVTPEQPTTPVTPEKPTTPVTPVAPTTPVTPKTPDTPAKPATHIRIQTG